jgi:hypothetical protein
LRPRASGISINGNAQLNSTYGVTSGSGTASDPYIIENYMIDAFDNYPHPHPETPTSTSRSGTATVHRADQHGAIRLNCTNLRDRNCILYYDYYGIYVRESTGVNITAAPYTAPTSTGYTSTGPTTPSCPTASCSTNTYGITYPELLQQPDLRMPPVQPLLRNAIATSNTAVSNCAIFGTTTYGIAAGSVSGISISDCDIGYAEAPVTFNYVNDSTITRCYIHNSGYDGISTFHCNRIAISYCDIAYSENSGIRAGYDAGDTITYCNLHDYYAYGVEGIASSPEYPCLQRTATGDRRRAPATTAPGRGTPRPRT